MWTNEIKVKVVIMYYFKIIKVRWKSWKFCSRWTEEEKRLQSSKLTVITVEKGWKNVRSGWGIEIFKWKIG